MAFWMEPMTDITCGRHGASLVRESAGHALTDPPVGIRAEPIAFAPLEFVHRAAEADVSLLDQVEHRKPTVDILACHADDEAEVGLHKPLACMLTSLDVVLQEVAVCLP